MIASTQVFLYLVLSLLAFGVQVWALLDAVRRPAGAFVAAGKRTKGFWVAILGVVVAFGFLTIPQPIGLGIFGTFGLIGLAAVIAAIVYLVDVRPAVEPYSRRRPGGRGSAGRSPGDRGGW